MDTKQLIQELIDDLDKRADKANTGSCTATGGNIRKLLSGECNAYGHSAELLKMLLEKLNNREAGEKNRLEIIREKVRAALKAATEAKQRAFNLGETSFQYNKGRIEMAQELLNLFF